jgi:hypothetical protein
LRGAAPHSKTTLRESFKKTAPVDEKWCVSIRLFARDPKNSEDGKAASPEADEGNPTSSDDLFIGEASPSGDRPDEVPGSQIPAVTLPGAQEGWSYDPNHPGPLQYWDGSQWRSNQSPDPSALSAPVPAAAKADVDEVPEFGEQAKSDVEGPVAEAGEPAAALTPGSSARTPDREDDSGGARVVVIGNKVHGGEGVALVPPSSQGVTRKASEGDYWAQQAEQAVARARTVDTSEAWGDAAEAASVVSEMTQTMRMAAEAKELASRLAWVAQEAGQGAQVASKAAAKAKESAAQMARDAQDAEQAAQVATKAAAEAKQKAVHAARAVPESEQAAKVAAQVADAAKHKAQEIERTVARAREANSPAAWSEALQGVMTEWAKKTSEISSHTIDPGGTTESLD